MLMAVSPRMRRTYERLDREAQRTLVARHGRPLDVVEGRLAPVTLPLVEQ
jgi:hypothetical protein